jgi:hypothetical protein
MDDLGDNLIAISTNEMMICNESMAFFRSFDLHRNSREDFIDSLNTYIDN